MSKRSWPEKQIWAGPFGRPVPVGCRLHPARGSSFLSPSTSYARGLCRLRIALLAKSEGHEPFVITSPASSTAGRRGRHPHGFRWPTGHVVAGGVGAAPGCTRSGATPWWHRATSISRSTATTTSTSRPRPLPRSCGRSTRSAAHGTTGVLLTLCTAPLAAYDEMLTRMAASARQRAGLVLGVHLEGPFLGGAPGAILPSCCVTQILRGCSICVTHTAIWCGS